jgi:hypothetical protein
VRIFSKVVTICNVCFLLSLLFRFLGIGSNNTSNGSVVAPLPWLQNMLIILGYGAIFLNIIFFSFYLFLLLFKKQLMVGRWLLMINLIIFIVQIIYFFTDLI